MLVEPAGPLKQGDILLAPVVRVSAADFHSPARWDGIDEEHHTVDRSMLAEPNLHVVSGRALVMVTSHDCHHDKEWNTAKRRLARDGRSEADAAARAEADPLLDRFFLASPVVPLTDLPEHDRGNYRAGRVVGFFPLDTAADDSLPASVVDLTYRCTVDRLAVDGRRWCLDEPARARLRYAIARFDSFRSVGLDEAIEAAVGRTITDVAVDASNRLVVTVTLDDGSMLTLVQPPTEPDPSGRTNI